MSLSDAGKAPTTQGIYLSEGRMSYARKFLGSMRQAIDNAREQ